MHKMHKEYLVEMFMELLSCLICLFPQNQIYSVLVCMEFNLRTFGLVALTSLRYNIYNNTWYIVIPCAIRIARKRFIHNKAYFSYDYLPLDLFKKKKKKKKKKKTFLFLLNLCLLCCCCCCCCCWHYSLNECFCINWKSPRLIPMFICYCCCCCCLVIDVYVTILFVCFAFVC